MGVLTLLWPLRPKAKKWLFEQLQYDCRFDELRQTQRSHMGQVGVLESDVAVVSVPAEATTLPLVCRKPARKPDAVCGLTRRWQRMLEDTA